MNNSQISADQINKVHDFLLASGQQELTGHFDGIVQELQALREDDSTNQTSTQPQNTAPDAQEGTQDESSDESRVSMQTFQDNATSGLVVPQSSNDTEPDLNDTDDDEQPSTAQ